MSVQKMHSSRVRRLPVDQYRLRLPQQVRAKLCGVEPDAGHHLNEPRVLARRQSAPIAPTGEQELARLARRQAQVLIYGLSGLVGPFEVHRPPVWRIVAPIR